MLEYERIDISDGIDVDMSDKSKECMLCHYWYFLDKNFSYGPYLCDGCYNIVQKCNKLKNIAIIHVKKRAHRIYFLYMSKREVKKLMTNSNLFDKKGVMQEIYFIYFFHYSKKMDNTTYYQGNKETMLNRARDYNENDKNETYLKTIKRKRENMEKIDVIICLKKRSKN